MRGKPLQPSINSRVLVCIDQIENHEIKGRFYTAFNNDVCYFETLVALFNRLDNIFDQYGFPQSTHQYRRFDGLKMPISAKPITFERINYTMENNLQDERGDKATFIVHVQFRQNASWQGTIQWVDGKKTQNFRSTLEMIKLMDEAMQNDETTEAIYWETE